MYSFNKTSIFILFLFFISYDLKADTLSLQQAISFTLTHNHGLKVAQIQKEIAENQATPGNANLYPKLTLSGGTNYSNQNTAIVFSGNIPKSEVKGAISTGYNTNLGMTYTLFDGLGVVYNYKKLLAQAEKSNEQWLLTIENTVIQVINTYVEILRWQHAVAVQESTLKVSLDRVTRIETGFKLGAKTSLDVLNAKVDFVNDSINLANAHFQMANLKRNLNWTMGQDIQTDFGVSLPDLSNNLANIDVLIGESLKNNRNFVLANLNKEMAKLDYSIANSKRFPVITGNLSYGLSHSSNGAGIVVSNDATGVSGGVNLNYNLFDGLKVKTQIDNANLLIQSNEELKKESEKTIARDVYNAWNGYQFSLQQQNSENQHVALAQLALKRSEEAYKNGQATALEFRQAQINVINAETKQYNTGLAVLKYYYELKKLNGSLVAS
jgi:outer membrane protein